MYVTSLPHHGSVIKVLVKSHVMLTGANSTSYPITHLVSLLALATPILSAQGKMAFIMSADTPIPTLLTYRERSVTSPATKWWYGNSVERLGQQCASTVDIACAFTGMQFVTGIQHALQICWFVSDELKAEWNISTGQLGMLMLCWDWLWVMT